MTKTISSVFFLKHGVGGLYVSNIGHWCNATILKMGKQFRERRERKVFFRSDIKILGFLPTFAVSLWRKVRRSFPLGLDADMIHLFVLPYPTMVLTRFKDKSHHAESQWLSQGGHRGPMPPNPSDKT